MQQGQLTVGSEVGGLEGLDEGPDVGLPDGDFVGLFVVGTLASN